jgi:hypothetical protein
MGCHKQKIETNSTKVSIVGEQFYINGKPTYEGKSWNGKSIEGLLFNSRMVQGIFDDLNPATRDMWQYPDTKIWDPERNTTEFIAAMPDWYLQGLVAFTINLQGGSPQGYSKFQPWHNSAIDSLGDLRSAYMDRLERIIDRADELGMVVLLGIFYFGQDERLVDEAAVIHAVENTVDWIFEHDYKNVTIELANECDNRKYLHEIIKKDNIHKLMRIVKGKKKDGWKIPVGTSFNGGSIPSPNVVKASDFILIHGNGVHKPQRITEMVAKTRGVDGYKPMPIVFNEDDHFDFDKPNNNFIAAINSGASWGFFDFRMDGEGYSHGYQSVPVNWQISSPRKVAFFDKLKEITGGLEIK